MLLRAVRRHKLIFAVFFVLGLTAGGAFAVIRPPMLTSKVLVVVPGTKFIQTEAVIAGSDPVLERAGRQVSPAISLDALRHRVQITTITTTVLSIAAQGPSADQAQDAADAVARSYVDFVESPRSPGGQISARILESATPATGTTRRVRLIETAIIGALVGALLGALAAATVGRTDRRLRQRDEIAGAIGVPVLASIPVGHPSDMAAWSRLLANYEPGVVHAWGLRKALRHVGVGEARSGASGPVTLAVVSLASDRRALAIGPQLAVFAASLGIPTALVIGRQQNPQPTAELSAAFANLGGDPNRLYFSHDRQGTDRPAGPGLTVVVLVVSGAEPQLADAGAPTASVIGVTAGAVTAEQLARVAVTITGDGRDIAGILVADPDPGDRTTGRLSELARPTHRKQPAHPGPFARITRASSEAKP